MRHETTAGQQLLQGVTGREGTVDAARPHAAELVGLVDELRVRLAGQAVESGNQVTRGNVDGPSVSACAWIAKNAEQATPISVVRNERCIYLFPQER